MASVCLCSKSHWYKTAKIQMLSPNYKQKT